MQYIFSQLVVIGFLFLFAILFSASETAFFSLKKSQIHRFSHSYKRTERIVYDLMRNPSSILITILAGNLLVHILISSFSTKMFLLFSSDYGHIIAVCVLTPVIVVFGEITPKIIALGNPELFSSLFARPMRFFHRMLYPFRLFFNLITKPFIKMLGLKKAESLSVTQEEIESAIDESEVNGYLTEEEAEFIRNVMRFPMKEASNIMIPRNHAVFIPEDATIDTALKIFREAGVVRAPVYSGNPDSIVGILDAREIMPYTYLSQKERSVSITKYINTIWFIPATKNIGDLLNDFLSKKMQTAIAVDEFGGTAGIVTLSSLITEILGKEFSLSDDESSEEIKEIEPNRFIVYSDIQITDFNLHFNENLESNESDTLAGYIIEQTGHFPSRNSIVETENFVIRVRSIRKNRIETVEVIRKDKNT